MTFPYEQTLKGEAREAFPAEFDALIDAAERARCSRGSRRSATSRRRARIFGVPAADGGAARRCSAQFVTEVFASTRFDQQILLRGVYFTSGTQEGTPIDRLLGAIGRRFARGARGGRVAGRARQGVLHRAAAQGRAARRVRARRRQPPPRGAEGGGAARRVRRDGRCSTMLGVVLLSVSYSRNRTYVDEVAADVARLEAVPPVGRGGVARDACCRDSTPLRAVSDSANRYRGGRRALGDAVGALPGGVARQRGARCVSARARRRAAAAGGGADQAAAGRLRAGAGEAVPVPQGLPDARRARASRQGAARVHRRSRVEESRRGRSRGRRGAVEALSPACSTTRTRLRAVALDQAARRAGAQHDSQASIPRAHLPPRPARLRRPTQRARCGSTSLPASAPTACSGARAGCRCPSRSRASTPRRCSRRSPAAAPTSSSGSSPRTSGSGAKAAVRRVGTRHRRRVQRRSTRRTTSPSGTASSRTSSPCRWRRSSARRTRSRSWPGPPRRCAGCSRRSTSTPTW